LKTKKQNNALFSRQEFYVVQDTITENKRKKVFDGADPVEKIFSCPSDKIISLNFAEAQKLSFLLMGKI
jgi:hypothetical protein